MSAPTVTIRWPVSYSDAIHAEILRADLPIDVGALVREAEQQAYARGHQAALREVTLHPELIDHLGPSWRDVAMTVRAEQIRHRDECAQARADARREADNIAAGRHPGYRYAGGPVDWETGLPAGSACAWLRNKRRREAEPATVTPIRPARPVVRREAAA